VTQNNIRKNIIIYFNEDKIVRETTSSSPRASTKSLKPAECCIMTRKVQIVFKHTDQTKGFMKGADLEYAYPQTDLKKEPEQVTGLHLNPE
jgi:hypothetical protein